MRVSELNLDYEFSDLLSEAEGEAHTQWAEQFTSDMRERYDEWGDEMFITDRQLEMLEKIAKV